MIDTLHLPAEGVDETVISWGDDPDSCFALDDEALARFIIALQRHHKARQVRVARQKKGQIAERARVVNHPLAG
ncbi:hypothetical protein IU485_27500 [Nocardia cyriacigeorgica]|uniref:hypothetical protein n=1 Tax=Nocardia cyriacigeorgica TaxID=135487 RepID=UPI001893147D|nr:hypothetical protein [Nocardia cyriacigeorgica]MBF6085122.1 hypothetical protein [Nocardia cyriacigeorgica]